MSAVVSHFGISLAVCIIADFNHHDECACIAAAEQRTQQRTLYARGQLLCTLPLYADNA